MISYTVNVTKEDTTEPTDPEEPVGDGSLLIELVDGNIKTYAVTSDEISDFVYWYKNRDLDDSESPVYKVNILCTTCNVFPYLRVYPNREIGYIFVE